MIVDFSKIDSEDKKQPMLRLQTLAGKELGVIPFAYNLRFTINYSDVSTIEFSVPYYVNGMINPLYASLTSYKVIHTDNLGIYILESPTKSNDGVTEIKDVKGYSLEQLFQTKNLFLEEGTYNFWNPVDSANTILSRIIELDSCWSVGYVAPRLIGCYRTFDQYDSDALGFCYGDAMDKYHCVFVFDVYKKTINAYDAADQTNVLPIYLSHKNLIESSDIQELADDIATKLHLSGSDGLTIREVNPTGTDYLVNLDYFLSNGDLDIKLGGSETTLAERVREWQASIAARQTYYTGVVSARASLTAQKLVAQADLGELKGELDSLVAQQSVTIQALALEKTQEGKASQQEKLDEINGLIDAKNAEIEAQEGKIASLDEQISQYMDILKGINSELSIEGFFNPDECEILNHFLIEATVSDETFVATSVDNSVSGAMSTISGSVRVTNSDLTEIDIEDIGKKMIVLSGGSLAVPNESVESGNILAVIQRGTLELRESGEYVFTVYLGDTQYGEHKFSSGLLTASGVLSDFTNDIKPTTADEVTENKGSFLSFQTGDARAYFTVSMNDYQSYSVQMELYDYGREVLSDYAWPVYEFNIDSGNFLYHEKFEPFKNKLELGKAVYLALGSEGIITAKIIGIELDFEDISSFSLVFSNQYQKKNGMESWVDSVQAASRASRSINSGKYTYNRAADKVTEVAELMRQQLVAAVNNIVNAEDQTVLINSSGINIGGDSQYQMRLVNNMIAMTDDYWQTAKLAIGLFATPDVGEQWGVNAEMLAGNILIGNKLVLQNPNDDGYMMFQIDETGAWLYNAQFVLQDGNTGGLVIIDPKYGIVAGNNLLFDTNGTTVTPEFMNETGDIVYDDEGMPENANFYLDLKDGNAYFRGKLLAKSGRIGGYTIENNYLHSGSNRDYVALNGGTDVYPEYAIWAGYDDPTSPNCPFWVKKDGSMKADDGEFTGTIHAEDGEFKGTVQASRYLDQNNNDMMQDGKFTSDYLDVRGLNVNDRFIVDENGNVTITDGSISWSAVDGHEDLDAEIEGAYSAASDAEEMAKKIANGTYSGGTFINGTEIYSPTIVADEFVVQPENRTNGVGGFSIYGYWGNSIHQMLHVYYLDSVPPSVVFTGWEAAGWSFDDTYFSGNIHFESANVSGITATWK